MTLHTVNASASDRKPAPVVDGGELHLVPFHDDQIVTFEHEGGHFVVMRRIVENMGLSWPRQHDKLIEQQGKFACTHMATHDAGGRKQEMLCMPVAKLPLWLASINPNKIQNEAIRAKIERYQAESAIALHDYWMVGVAVRDDLDGVVTALTPNVENKIGGIVKQVVRRQIKDALGSLLPELIAAQIASGEFSIGKGYTAGQVIDLAKVPGAPGLKGLDKFVSGRLRVLHQAKGVVMRLGQLGKRTACLFDPATCREWLTNGGREAIEMRVRERRGQGALRLVLPKKEG